MTKTTYRPLPRRHCLRCGYRWIPRTDMPAITCAQCRSPYWDKPRLATREKRVKATS
jgi:DNA-directed RNA polymerase subunit RPC12/RpoP